MKPIASKAIASEYPAGPGPVKRRLQPKVGRVVGGGYNGLIL